MLGLAIATDSRPAPPPAWSKLASGPRGPLAWSDASESSDLAVFSWQGRDSLHARYYNPTIARFLSVDPGRDNNPKVPQTWNLYAYVRNNPVNSVDPDGKMMVNAVILAAALADNKDGKLKVVPASPAQQQKIANMVRMFSPVPLAAVATTKAAQVVANAAQGKAAEAFAKQQLLAEGSEILGQNVAANTSLGRRVIDYLTRTPADELLAVEVKSGGAEQTAMQVAKNTEMATTGAVLVGKNAPLTMRDVVTVIQTVVLWVP